MPSHPRRSRLRRGLLAALVAASVAVPVSGAATPAAVPAPAPAAHGPLRTAAPEALAERYAATRADIGAAERAAARHGDRKRAAALHELAAPAAASSPSTAGTAAAPSRSSAICPTRNASPCWSPEPASTSTTTGGCATVPVPCTRSLGGRSAVVAWLGYRTPTTVSPTSITSARAIEAAPELARFSRELTRLRPAARTTLLCHSYGSVVCARAAHGLRVSGIVLYGSPGTGYRNAAALHTPATVWAGRAGGDWIAGVPHIELRLPFADIGFGTDPVSPGFGAEPFAAGSGGHSDYLKSGSEPLRNIARIVAGTAGSAEPTGERHA